MRKSPRPPAWPSTSVTHTRPGSAAPTKTPTGCCASTSPRAATCPDGDRATSTWSPPNSTTGPANDSAGGPPPRPSRSYCPNRQIHLVLRPPLESAAARSLETKAPRRTLAPVPRIDLDAYVVAHSHEWARLDQLVRSRRLTGPESDELVDRYQQVATHLSVIRTSAPDAEVVAYLSSLLGRTRISMLGARVLSWRAVGLFFTEQFPAALYRMRWWWLGCMAANIIVTAVLMWWFVDHPEVEQSLLSGQEIDDLVNNDFESYYSENAASAF